MMAPKSPNNNLLNGIKGTIPMFLQQKDWVGGLRKSLDLLTFSTVFMLIVGWVGSKKIKNMLTYYRDGPKSIIEH